MNRNKPAISNRTFSIELKLRSALRTATLENGQGERVTIEGTIGVLERAGFVEDTILELVGTQGALRVDMSREDLAETSKNHTGGEGR